MRHIVRFLLPKPYLLCSTRTGFNPRRTWNFVTQTLDHLDRFAKKNGSQEGFGIFLGDWRVLVLVLRRTGLPDRNHFFVEVSYSVMTALLMCDIGLTGCFETFVEPKEIVSGVKLLYLANFHLITMMENLSVVSATFFSCPVSSIMMFSDRA